MYGNNIEKNVYCGQSTNYYHAYFLIYKVICDQCTSLVNVCMHYHAIVTILNKINYVYNTHFEFTNHH